MKNQKQFDSLESNFKPIIIKMIAELAVMGIVVIPTSTGGRRTMKDQHELWLKGRDVLGNVTGRIVTKADQGQSPHNFGLAIDLVPIRPNTDQEWWDAPDDVWNAMHRIGESLGLVCGYDFKSIKDSPHFETRNWKAAQARWKAGKLVVL